jgi:DHA2 family multidrug resistance protein
MAEAGAVYQQRHINPWLVATSVMFGTFMEVLDTTVVNVSLPHIAGSLSATVDEATWVLTSYLVANATILPITGWLANQIGRKRLLMTSVVGFTISSFLCGLAPSLSALVFFRVLQGLSGGALQPLSQAVLLEAFPPQDRGKAMAFWGFGIVVAPILGPVLGGWLTDSYSWRWVFYINIPVGIGSILMTRLFIWDPPYIQRRAGRIDFWGIGLLAIAIGALQIMLDKGQQEDWFSSYFIRTLLTLAIVGGAAFVARELIARHPVVNLRILKERTFSAGVLLITSVMFVLYGSMVLIPIWLQTLLGYPALQAGFALAPRGLGSFIAMPIVGILIPKVDARRLLVLGMLTCAVTMFAISRLSLDAGYWDFFWPQFFQGVSLSMLFVPITTVTMGPIAREQMGNAASLYSLMRNLGASFGIATVTTYVARREQIHTHHLVAHLSPYIPQANAMLNNMQRMMEGRGSGPVTSVQQGYLQMWGMVERQAAILSYLDAFVLLAGLFVVLVPLIFLMKKPPKTTAAASAAAAH